MTVHFRARFHRYSMLTELNFANVGKRKGLGRSVLVDRPTLECVKAAVFDSSYPDSAVARVVFILTGVPSGIGEIGTALWLLVMGAGERKASFNEPAHTARNT